MREHLLVCKEVFAKGVIEHLEPTQQFADIGIAKLFRNDRFVRQPGDEYYKAKPGTGRYVLGMLRLYLAQEEHLFPDKIDWSI